VYLSGELLPNFSNSPGSEGKEGVFDKSVGKYSDRQAEKNRDYKQNASMKIQPDKMTWQLGMV